MEYTTRVPGTYAADMVREGGSDHDPVFGRTPDSDVTNAVPRAERLLSVDLLRGATIAFMILVNNQPGPDAFAQLNHAQWNGFTLTDLVFPTFLFLVGLSVVLSMHARLQQGARKATLLLHGVRRAFVLALLGLVVNTFPFQHLDLIRFYGVLQRIALCYIVVTVLCLLSRGWKSKAGVAVLCLVSYWLLMRFVPVPGFGTPTHEVPINDPNGNLTAYVDRMLFAPQHLYQRVRDPEGLLSTLPSVATALYGVLAGIWLRSSRSISARCSGLAAAGVTMVLSGWVWSIAFPINKKLWTSSFSLYAGGWSLLLLASAVFAADVRRWGRQGLRLNEPPRAYRPLMVFGTNSILAYMISELLPPTLAVIRTSDGTLLRSYFQLLKNVVPAHGWADLLFGLSFVVATWLLVLPLYRRRIFLRV